MSGHITLTQDELQILSDVTKNNTTNFTSGYLTLYGQLLKHIAKGDGQLSASGLFWYSQAYNINANNGNALGAVFILNTAAYGGVWKGLKHIDLQGISDHIAESVIGTALKTGVAYDTNDLLLFDISASLDYGQISIGGWGGSFYYWNTPFKDGLTVGQAVLKDPLQYDTFLAATSNGLLKAVGSAVRQLGGNLNFSTFWDLAQQVIPTAVESAAPLAVKADIALRVFGVLSGTSDVAGDPNNINGYLYLGKNIFTGKSLWIKSISAYLSPEQNISGNSQLDQMRDIRIANQNLDYQKYTVGIPGIPGVNQNTTASSTVVAGNTTNTSTSSVVSTTGDQHQQLIDQVNNMLSKV